MNQKLPRSACLLACSSQQKDATPQSPALTFFCCSNRKWILIGQMSFLKRPHQTRRGKGWYRKQQSRKGLSGGGYPGAPWPGRKTNFPRYPPKRVLAACTGKTEQQQTTCVSEKAGVRNPRLAGLLLRFV